MPYFEYSKSVKDVEYYEILEMLMERWEVCTGDYVEIMIICFSLRQALCGDYTALIIWTGIMPFSKSRSSMW